MGVKGFKTGRGQLGSVTPDPAMEVLGPRFRIDVMNSAAQPTTQPGGAPKPHWLGKVLPSAIVRPDRLV